MLCFGVGDILYKRAAATGVGAAQFVMLQAWVFAPAINIYAWATGTLDVHWSAAWGSLAGVFTLIAFYNFARSLKDGAVSLRMRCCCIRARKSSIALGRGGVCALDRSLQCILRSRERRLQRRCRGRSE